MQRRHPAWDDPIYPGFPPNLPYPSITDPYRLPEPRDPDRMGFPIITL